jgi:transglutaminase-like putative cysteine protease
VTDEPRKEDLCATSTIEVDHPSVREFCSKHGEGNDDVSRAVALYYAIRDGIRYDPYTCSADIGSLKASFVLSSGRGWCVSKAILLAACCRSKGIPSRLGFADVRNHLSTARLRELMQTDVFSWHGYTSLYLLGQWVKATPAFNVELCEKFRLKPLEFDGRQDSIYHPFDLEGNKHMEYLRFRGEFADTPIAEIAETFARVYPFLKSGDSQGSFDQEVESETRGIADQA